MPAVEADFILYKGEDASVTVTVYQSNGTTPQDITGWSVSFVLHATRNDGLALVTKTVGSGIALTTPGSGLLTITLEDTDTSGLDPGWYRFYVARTGAGVEAVLTTGRVHLRPR